MTTSTSSMLVFDLDCRGAEHELFNAACIEALAIANPTSTLTFLAQDAHMRHVLPLLAGTGRTVHSEALPAPKGRELSRSNPVLIIRHITALVRAHAQGSKSQIVFLSCGVRSFVAIQLLALLWQHQPMLVLFHGALEKLEPTASSTSAGDRLFRWLFSHKLSRNLRYGVLGPSIQRHLSTVAPTAAAECVVLDLPYLFPAEQPMRSPPDAHVVFGHIGYAHALKGSEDFMAIASSIKASAQHGERACFVMAGGVDPSNPRLHSNPSVAYPQGSWPIPREAYAAIMATMDYAVFTYPLDSYRLRASGAVFDAIAFCTPVICLRTPYFEYIFDVAGDIGYLCDTVADIHVLCQHLIDAFPVERHALQRSNLRKAQDLFTPKNIAAQLRERYFEQQPETRMSA